MNRWIDHAYMILRRHIPGQWDRLRGTLEQAPEDVQMEFFRVVQAFEAEVDKQRRRARMPWRGPLGGMR
jgi:hypothetical protein